MELRNKSGDVTQIADNLTLKDLEKMGFTIDLCDTAYDPNEHWMTKNPNEDLQRRRDSDE